METLKQKLMNACEIQIEYSAGMITNIINEREELTPNDFRDIRDYVNDLERYITFRKSIADDKMVVCRETRNTLVDMILDLERDWPQ